MSNSEWLVKEYERHRTEARAAEAKASWAKVVAKMNGKTAKTDTAPELANPRSSVVTKINARNGKSAAESRATRSGWAAVVAALPSRRG